MTRRQPLNNGKPRKTEPGAVRFQSEKNNTNEQQHKKLDETV